MAHRSRTIMLCAGRFFILDCSDTVCRPLTKILELGAEYAKNTYSEIRQLENEE